ncbi:hypothetical protein FRB94_004813 [Tulasnella sp. JGI-2019a]|nr:hypothetical protein FRB93_005548 [Tulasnella sp. JGI-2019a]KAG9001401.1 hypothetical protein FRB94_004813 [Tulasnella sp. JGI-2019a]KAG9029465.1 hypothetical protein FRB95_005307 [Tulasnella sp. JGI-2019a]
MNALIDSGRYPLPPSIYPTPQTPWEDHGRNRAFGSRHNIAYDNTPLTLETAAQHHGRRSEMRGQSVHPYSRPRRSDDWPVNRGVTPTPFPTDTSVFYSPTNPDFRENGRASSRPALATSSRILSPPMESPSWRQGVIDFNQTEEFGGPSSLRKRSWQGKPWAACECSFRTVPQRMDHHWNSSCPSNPNPIRFECDDPSCGCGKTFSSKHNRKRHLEARQNQPIGAMVRNPSPSGPG